MLVIFFFLSVTGVLLCFKGFDFIGYESTEIVPQSVWGTGVELGFDGFEGNVYHMMTYVPDVTNFHLRLDLFQEEYTTGKRYLQQQYICFLNQACTKRYCLFKSSHGVILDSYREQYE